MHPALEPFVFARASAYGSDRSQGDQQQSHPDDDCPMMKFTAKPEARAHLVSSPRRPPTSADGKAGRVNSNMVTTCSEGFDTLQKPSRLTVAFVQLFHGGMRHRNR